jgi:hypothetical protein
MRVGTACGAVALAAVVLAGCGGEAEQHFTRADAVRIANVRPTAPGWEWPSNPAKPGWSDSSTPPASTDPILAEFHRAKADLVDVGDAEKEWEDANKLGHLDVGVYGSAADAHRAMTPFDTASRKWGAQTGRRVTQAGPVEGIGDEAWRLRVMGNGPQVTYHWRRGNLVVEAHVHCFGRCPADVDAAARAWVDVIDATATSGS